MIVKSMAKRLRAGCDQSRMVTTDRVLPLGSLRRECVKNLFNGWVLQLVGKGRIITKKLSMQVLLKLRKTFNLPIRSAEDHKEEAFRLHGLLKSSRKQQLGKNRATSAMSFIDQLDTQPMEEHQDGIRTQKLLSGIAVRVSLILSSICLYGVQVVRLRVKEVEHHFIWVSPHIHPIYGSSKNQASFCRIKSCHSKPSMCLQFLGL